MASVLIWEVKICLIQRLKIDSAIALTNGTGGYLGYKNYILIPNLIFDKTDVLQREVPSFLLTN